MTTTPETEQTQGIPQGDLRLLETELAQSLLRSSIPARLAFVWTGEEIVMVTYVAGPNIGIRHPAARLAALRANPDVTLIIDTEPYPPQSLTIRGQAQISYITGLAPEYAAAARRYLGDSAAQEMLAGLDQPALSRPESPCVRPG